MKTDARVRYTRMRLREAFLRCLQEKPVSRITVTELCEMAQINRATFYTHYADPMDLMEKLETDTLSQLRSMIGQHATDGDDVLLTSLLQGLQARDSAASLLSSANGDPSFSAKVSALFYETLLPRMEDRLPELSAPQRKAVYRFLAGGCANLMADWVNSGMKTQPEELAQQMRALSEAVIRGIQSQRDL